VRDGRERDIAYRREAITGTSAFPLLAENPVAVLTPVPAPLPAAEAGQEATRMPAPSGFADLVARASAGASLAELRPPLGDALRVTPLPSRRDAEPFERLREASDAMLARTGARPRIFLAPLGPVAAFTSRAAFAKSFFESGGIEAVSPEGPVADAELAAAFRASGARLACLCSSDELYAEKAPDAAAALRAAGARRIYLAGRPGEHAAAWSAAGVGAYVHAGCDAVATLEAALAEAGSCGS
jgi:methylmalonyl-CoA mutase